MAGIDAKDIMCALGLVLGLGILLLFLRSPAMEGFTNDGAMRCDIYSPCSAGLKCINGFCAKTDPRPLVEPTPVPLLPPGSPAPYF